MICLNSNHLSTAANGTDYLLLSSVPLTFSSGSGNGTENCAAIYAKPDDQVECEEYSMAILELATAGTSLDIGKNTSTITILDYEGT